MSRQAFEEWFKREGYKTPFDLFAAWQAAESHTATACHKIAVECYEHHIAEELIDHADGAGTVCDGIKDAYPDAFKEGE